MTAPPSPDDVANGYDAAAEAFMEARGGAGALQVERWARELPPGARVLDLGCGYGGPITEALDAVGVKIYGVDASPRLIAEFRRRWPNATSLCSTFDAFDFAPAAFDGIVAWGVVFLLTADEQRRLVDRAAYALAPGGRFLFTAPWQHCEWTDVLTGRTSRSLGIQAYRELLEMAGLRVFDEDEDEDDNGNHYYHAAAAALGSV